MCVGYRSSLRDITGTAEGNDVVLPSTDGAVVDSTLQTVKDSRLNECAYTSSSADV